LDGMKFAEARSLGLIFRSCVELVVVAGRMNCFVGVRVRLRDDDDDDDDELLDDEPRFLGSLLVGLFDGGPTNEDGHGGGSEEFW
jgi:hypothetical protein